MPEKKTPRHPMLAPGLLMLASVAASMLVVRFVPRPSGLVQAALFHQGAQGWERVPQPPDQPQEVRVSPNGVVWVVPLVQSGVSRLEGATWRKFSKADFGACTGYIEGPLALDGEDVWAAVSKGVLHWDGQRWQCYHEAVASKYAYSIVAAAGHVWVIDYWGNLSEFDGTRWSIRQLELPGVNWRKDKGPWPQLARTADGALWLMRGAVWRFDGAKWAAVNPPAVSLKDAWLVGSTGDRIWLRDDMTLRSVSADGRTWADYPREEYVHNVASTHGHLWFAIGGAIEERTGTDWRSVALPEKVSSVRSIDAGPDGRLWAVGMTRTKAMYFWMALMLAPLGGIVAAFLWAAKRKSRRQRVEHERVQQAVQLATGAVPDQLRDAQRLSANVSDPWRGALLFGGSLIAALVTYTLVHRRWRAQPAWMFLVYVVSIHVAVTFVQSLSKRKPLPSDPIGPGAPPRYDWAKTWKAAGAGLLFVVMLNLPHMSRYVWLAMILLPFAINVVATRLINAPARRGDYDGALRNIRRLHFLSPRGAMARRNAGAVLLLAKRYREAEENLRAALAGLPDGLNQALALDSLGDALMEQGRDDEAMRTYEASLHAYPGLQRARRGMAEMVLRCGGNPQQALEYVENMKSGAGLSWAVRRMGKRQQDDYWSLKAWALAQLGRSAEVAPAIGAAFKATNKKSRPDLAVTNYRAGMAMRAIGNESAAVDYFKRARDLDPNGRRGSLAQAALAERSAWGASV